MLTNLFTFLWLIISILFITFITITFIEGIKQKKYKSFLIVSIITFIAGLICFILMMTFYNIEPNNLKTVSLKDGYYEVGKDIEPGHYEIRSRDNKGYIAIKAKTDDRSLNEQFGTNYGTKNKPIVPSVTTYLFKGDKISLDNTNLTTFKQIENKKLYKLSTGMWIVGKDVEPGKYKVHLTYSREYGGIVKILTYNFNDKSDFLSGEEVEDIGIKEFEVELKENEDFIVHHIYSITLEKE
ncbi:hypothetical protein CD128_00655 [Staphylococcus croceilyticus]|uniref:hypothetical protein n=1 Tax=Staphylococcus croceilyticus TaxID=319942 RepID=UPI000CD03EA3|nr:hypothetical protein [Staphylococcus croceilyticus]PNZ70890.1 hypothetical protein CD128_00655 [Staphylococcus croceilyticus]